MFNFMSLLSLNILIFAPVVAAIITASPMFGTNPIYIRRFVKSFATVHFLYSLLFVLFYGFSDGSFYDEITVYGSGWLSKLGVNAAFGADEFTVLLAACTSLIFLLAFIMSKTFIRTKHKMYYTLMLLLLSNTLGIFCAKDMFVFLMFWEAEIIPLYLLISQWGSEGSREAAVKYAMYAFVSGMFITVAMIGLYYYGYQANQILSSSIDFLRIYRADGIYSDFIEKIIFWCFFIGFAFKVPLFPFHTAITDVHSKAVMPINMITASLLMTTGAYGIIRFNLDLFPEFFTEYSAYIMIFAVFCVLWTAIASLQQKNINKTVSYICISYLGLFLAGVAALNKIGFNGAFFIMFSYIFISAGLFFISGILQQTCKTSSILEFSGVAKYMPRFTLMAYIVAFAVIGVPLTVGFAGKLTVLSGMICADLDGILPKILTILALFCGLLITSAVLHLFNNTLFKSDNIYKKFHDISGHKVVVFAIICFFILLFGCFPDTLTGYYDRITDMLVEILRV